uniref:Uncharacterized protein n=1 Tax=Strongyloides venezuelensis TaxID=75913 RepID=A0A0K0FVF9_STRVS
MNTNSTIRINKLKDNRLRKNIFRKVDLVRDESINKDNDNILTNIAIIEEILQRVKKVRNNSLEYSHDDNNIENIQKSQNNNMNLIEKTNVAKFFIGDDDEDYQDADGESSTAKNSNLLNNSNSNLSFQHYPSNIQSKSVLDLTNNIGKNPSIFQTRHTLSEITLIPSLFQISEKKKNRAISNTNSSSKENQKYNTIGKRTIINFKKQENIFQHVLQSKIYEISNEIKKEFIGLKRSHSHLSLKSLVST